MRRARATGALLEAEGEHANMDALEPAAKNLPKKKLRAPRKPKS